MSEAISMDPRAYKLLREDQTQLAMYKKMLNGVLETEQSTGNVCFNLEKILMVLSVIDPITEKQLREKVQQLIKGEE